MDFPRMTYRVGTAWVLECGTFDLKLAESAEHLVALQADGWHLDAYDAKAAADAFAVPTDAPAEEPDDDAPPTRAELEAKARELGIKFDGRTGDKKLAALIADKLA